MTIAILPHAVTELRLLATAGGLLLLGCPADGPGSSDTEANTDGIVTASATEPGAGTDETSSGDGTAGADSSEGPDNSCGEAQFMLDVAPARVLLVLDKSGSMVSNTWDHDEDPSTDEITRWASLHATVDLVTTRFDGGLELGVLLYPSLIATSTYDANACLVASEPEVGVAPGNGQAVLAAIPGAMDDEDIQGGTPAATAMEIALEHLRTFDDQYARAVLFVTDGEANCRSDAEPGMPTQLFEEYDENLHTVVENGFQTDGIPTYVVGIAIRDEVLPAGGPLDGVPDGINPHERLDELAGQGGRPRPGGGPQYYATDSQIELEMALQEIATQEISCVIALDPPPEYPAFVEMEVGGEPVEHVDDCATEDGWVFSQPDGPYDSVELCGTACDLLAAEGMIQAFYGCPPPA